MFRKFAFWLAALLGGGLLLMLFFVGWTIAHTWHNNHYKSVIEIVELPSEYKQFVLLTDLSGFDDRGWYVYQSRLGSSLTQEQREAHNSDGALFWNYSEAGEHKSNPYIRLISDRYLVFSRGELDHSLYDLKSNRVLVNEISPWGAAIAKPDLNLTPEAEATVLDKWVRENLHGPIQSVIKPAT